jgi:hypothetical protein
MTAGSGIIHQEMPKGSKTGILKGFQLWANLPARDKMILSSEVKASIICGTIDGITGPVKDIVIDPKYIDVSVPADTTFVHPFPMGHTVLAYIIDRHAYFDNERNPFSMKQLGRIISILRETAGSVPSPVFFMNAKEKKLRSRQKNQLLAFSSYRVDLLENQ